MRFTPRSTRRRPDARARASVDPDATRRTEQARSEYQQACAAATRVDSGTRGDAADWLSRRPVKAGKSHRLRTVLLIAALLLVSNELIVGFRAGRVAAAAATRDLDGMDDIWAQYDALSHRSYLRVGVHGLERTLTDRVRTLSEQVSRTIEAPCRPFASGNGRSRSEACSRRSCSRLEAPG